MSQPPTTSLPSGPAFMKPSANAPATCGACWPTSSAIFGITSSTAVWAPSSSFSPSGWTISPIRSHFSVAVRSGSCSVAATLAAAFSTSSRPGATSLVNATWKPIPANLSSRWVLISSLIGPIVLSFRVTPYLSASFSCSSRPFEPALSSGSRVCAWRPNICWASAAFFGPSSMSSNASATWLMTPAVSPSRSVRSATPRSLNIFFCFSPPSVAAFMFFESVMKPMFRALVSTPRIFVTATQRDDSSVDMPVIRATAAVPLARSSVSLTASLPFEIVT